MPLTIWVTSFRLGVFACAFGGRSVCLRQYERIDAIRLGKRPSICQSAQSSRGDGRSKYELRTAATRHAVRQLGSSCAVRMGTSLRARENAVTAANIKNTAR
jgi:hypothetical protein